MLEKFKVSDNVQIELNLEPSVQNRNSAFSFLAQCICATGSERRISKAICDVATKHGWYVGDFVTAINELIEFCEVLDD